MTRAAVALLAALACASTTGGGVRATETPERARLAASLAVAAAPADTLKEVMPHRTWNRKTSGLHAAPGGAHPLNALTITGTAPFFKQAGSCGTTDTLPARCTAVALYRIGHRHPLYRRGDEFDAALWTRDTAYGEPIQVASVGVVDGAAFAFTVPDTLLFMVKVRWAEYGPGSREHETDCWQYVRR